MLRPDRKIQNRIGFSEFEAVINNSQSTQVRISSGFSRIGHRHRIIIRNDKYILTCHQPVEPNLLSILTPSRGRSQNVPHGECKPCAAMPFGTHNEWPVGAKTNFSRPSVQSSPPSRPLNLFALPWPLLFLWYCYWSPSSSPSNGNDHNLSRISRLITCYCEGKLCLLRPQWSDPRPLVGHPSLGLKAQITEENESIIFVGILERPFLSSFPPPPSPYSV